MPYMNPGFAIASALEDFMVKKAMQERQDKLDAQADQKFQFEMEKAQKAAAREDEIHALKLEDRERALHEKKMAGKVIGDFISPTDIVSGHDVGEPVRTTVAPPMPEQVKAPGIITEMSPDGASGETPVAELPAGSIRFGGSPEQYKEQQTKQARQDFMQKVAGMSPEERTKNAPALELAARDMGLNVTAASFEPPAPKSDNQTMEEQDLAAYAASKGKKPEQLTYEERLAFRKQRNQIDDRPVNINAGGLTPAQRLSNTRLLAANWRKETATSRELERQFGIMKTGLDRYDKDPIGGGEAVITTFKKILDPSSVVRESEYDRSAAAQSLKSRMQGWIERYGQGGVGIPKPELAEMLKTAEAFVKGANDTTSGVRRSFEAMAAEYGIDPVQIFGDDKGSSSGSTSDGTYERGPDGKLRLKK